MFGNDIIRNCIEFLDCADKCVQYREFPLFTVLLCAVSGILKNWNDAMKMAKEPCQGFGIYVLNHEL